MSFIYKLSDRVANTLTAEEGRELLTNEENQALDNKRAVHLAAKKRVAALDDGDIQEALKEVDDELEVLQSRMDSLSMEIDNQELWDGIEIWDNIYPRDATYTVRDYENTVKQVVREGQTAAGILADSLDLVDDEELREIQPDDDGGPGRGFA